MDRIVFMTMSGMIVSPQVSNAKSADPRPRDGMILPRGYNFGGGRNRRITPKVVRNAEVLLHRETQDFWAMPKEMNHYGNVYSQLAGSY